MNNEINFKDVLLIVVVGFIPLLGPLFLIMLSSSWRKESPTKSKIASALAVVLCIIYVIIYLPQIPQFIESYNSL